MVFVVDQVALPLPRQKLRSAAAEHCVLKSWRLNRSRLTHLKSRDEACISVTSGLGWHPVFLRHRGAHAHAGVAVKVKLKLEFFKFLVSK